MTNYNERLDEVLTTCGFEPEDFNSSICKWCGERKGAEIHTAKAAIKQLIADEMLELIGEDEPEGFADIPEAYRNIYRYELRTKLAEWIGEEK